MNAGTAPAGSEKIACTLTRFAIDHLGAGDRQTFAQDLVDEHRQKRADEAADDAAAAAKDRGASDDHRGDDDQLGVEAGLGEMPLSWAAAMSAATVAQSEDRR